jgi:hypothetical protein
MANLTMGGQAAQSNLANQMQFGAGVPYAGAGAAAMQQLGIMGLMAYMGAPPMPGGGATPDYNSMYNWGNYVDPAGI